MSTYKHFCLRYYNSNHYCQVAAGAAGKLFDASHDLPDWSMNAECGGDSGGR